jgi:hypothetical protein
MIFYFHMPEGFCFAGFFVFFLRGHTLHVFHLCFLCAVLLRYFCCFLRVCLYACSVFVVHLSFRNIYIYSYIYIIVFLHSTQDIKRVISKRDGCEYLKQVSSSDGSLMRSSGHILLSLLPISG